MDNELKDRIKLAEMKARHINKLIPWYKKWWGITIIVISAIVISIVTMSGMYIYQSVKKIQNDRAALYSGQRPDLIKLLVEGQGRPFMGNASSSIVIVQFSDFACPYCKENQPAIQAIMKKYNSQVKMIFRNLILHSDSQDLAMASLCAGEQKKNGNSLFWPMHDQLFALQGKITKPDLETIAVALGADKKIFDNCMNSQKYLGVLQADMDAALSLNITGSPTWFINNYQIDGEVSKEELESMISDLIKNGPGIDAVNTASSSANSTVSGK